MCETLKSPSSQIHCDSPQVTNSTFVSGYQSWKAEMSTNVHRCEFM